jgi:hypothetical protein
MAAVRIYKVVTKAGETFKIWLGYQSAVNCAAHFGGTVQMAEVPDELWRDANGVQERAARRVTREFEALVWSQQERAEQLIEELKGLVAKRAKVAYVPPEQLAASMISEAARREAEVMLKLDRLVDAG